VNPAVTIEQVGQALEVLFLREHAGTSANESTDTTL
jgi:hypothetical protein